MQHKASLQARVPHGAQTQKFCDRSYRQIPSAAIQAEISTKFLVSYALWIVYMMHVLIATISRLSQCTASRMHGPSRRTAHAGCKTSSTTNMAAFLTLVLCVTTVGARKLLAPAADQLDTEESYECIGSGSVQHPCIINPAYTFAAGIKLSSTSLPDRMYQSILAQHVVCRQQATQSACHSTPASAKLYCSWDSMNSRCLPDPYASLLMPMLCPGSKALAFMNCGRKGLINACRTDTECVLGKQARCFPAWLVSEARAKNKTEQEVAEATALALLKADEGVTGSCPTAKLLQRTMQACPHSNTWETCDTSLCDFSTPTFIPSRTQPLDLGNATATIPAINEAAMPPNNASGLPYFDMFPGPVCFPDVARIPMVLHSLLGITDDVSEHLDQLQTKCIEADDVVYDVAKGVAACGLDTFSYNRQSLFRAVGLPQSPQQATPTPAPAAPVVAMPAPGNNSQQAQPGAPAAAAAPQPASSATTINPGSNTNSNSSGISNSTTITCNNSSSIGGNSTGSHSNSTQGAAGSNQQQKPKVATEIGYRG